MLIDEDMKYAMTNFTQVPKGGRAVDSDQMTTLAKMKLNIVPHKVQKHFLYNLKNSECQKLFKINTTTTKYFTRSLNNMQHLQIKCEKWKLALDTHINQAFRKMRVRKSKIKPSEADNLINKRNKLKKKKEPNNQRINELDLQISELLIKEGVDKANQFRKYCDQKSTLPMQKVWKLKKQTVA